MLGGGSSPAVSAANGLAATSPASAGTDQALPAGEPAVRVASYVVDLANWSKQR